MARSTPHVFSIPAGIPFAQALSQGVIARAGADPLLLADALVFVPTRRAARTLREAFSSALGGAALLPRIRALGDVGEDEESFDFSEVDLAATPPLPPLRRRLLLSRLVQRWALATGAPVTFTQALGYAGELGRFLDEAMTQGVDLTQLKSLAPESLAAHWSQVVQFLDIVAQQWPELLRSEGASEPAECRDARLRALAQDLMEKPPRAPVIAAGSTGSIPATAELLKAIAHLPTGAVVLPALDGNLDSGVWDTLDPAHAQFGLQQLLARIGIERDQVAPWSPLPQSYPTRAARVRFFSEALRPPPATDAWRDLIEKQRGEFADSLSGVALIEAQTSREEALVVACALREVLETPSRTAALVTPDRQLARRVASELMRWDVSIDDSAGSRLSDTPPGAFLALLARAASERFAPVPLLALLKHPLAAGGQNRAQFRQRVRALELAALRGLRPEPGVAGIAARLTKVNAPFSLQNWFAKLARLLEPLAIAFAQDTATVSDLARTHGEVAEELAATDEHPGADALWRGPAGEAAATLLSDLVRDGADVALAPARHYAEAFRELAGTRAVRPRYNLHPRLAILGPLEARLLDFDLVVLSGLNEGQWPAEAATDPWLSRPMRQALGLEAPERRTGLAAHDFQTLAASRELLLTRSLKENGAPTLPSRWLLRVKQLANGLGLNAALDARKDLLIWARTLDDAPRQPRVKRPAPRPPAAARPRSLSITEIETWLRDPYAIYAKHVLKLKPLNPLDEDPGPRERGIAVHAALERFLLAYPAELPPDAAVHLLRFGEEEFARVGATEAVLALWRPRFERAARWLVAYEREHRNRVSQSLVEATGVLELPTTPKFILRGRADRIDILRTGTASIIDYKTGRVPSDRQVQTLVSPQLPLEGAMLMADAFGDIGAARLHSFVYVKLTGSEPPGVECVVNLNAEEAARDALGRLIARVQRFDDADTPYPSRDAPFRLTDIGDYDHLARVREWSVETMSDE
jgi:ATP-dependent helicase/nuclease subunit B